MTSQAATGKTPPAGPAVGCTMAAAAEHQAGASS
jgi:hypothetical protein